MKHKNHKKGFAALIGVLILGTVAMIMIPALMLNTIEVFRTNTDISNANIARSLADSCAEKALDNLRQNNSYAGNENINFSAGACNIANITGTAPTLTIQTSATYNFCTKKVRVVTSQVNPQITISTWEEIQ